MKKITFMLLFFITALTYGQDFVNCSQTFTTSGPDSAGTQLIINAADITCNDGLAINSISVESATGSFTSGFCSLTGGGWFEFFLSIDGGAEQAVCAAELNGLDLTGFSSLVITSSDTDDFTDTVTMTLNLDVEHEAPSCVEPINLEADVTGTSSADLSWDAVSNAESYNWFVFEQGANIETDTPADSGTSATNSATSTGLNSSSFYFFYVVTDCGVDDGVSENSATVPFTTECDTFGDFSNDFSDEVTFELPLCWTGNTVSTGTAPNLRVTTVGSPQFGTKQIHMQSSGDANTVHHLISPELNNLGTVDKRLRISARQLTATQTNALEVGVMSDPSDLSTFSVIETINFEGNTLTDYDIILPEGTTENYFAFKTIFSGTFQTIYIDRVVYEDNPSCLEPSGVSEVSVGLNSVEIEWNEVVGVDDYEVAYGEAGFDPETEGDILLIEGFTTATILGLLEGEEYDFYVRALCSDVDISSWSDVLSALTLVEGATCDVAIPITSLPFTDSGNTADFGDNYSNTDRPSIDNAQFTDGTGGASYLNGDDVVYSFTPANDGVFNFELNDIGTWVGFWLFEGCSPFTGTIAYSTTSSGNDRLLPAIQLEAGVTYYVVISTFPTPQSTPYELVVTEVLCASPSELEVDTIAADSAEFSWTASADADAYDWFLMNEGENPEDDTPVDSGSTVDTTLVVEDLDADTNYTLFVRSDCSASESDFIQISFFTGYCVPTGTSANTHITNVTAVGLTTLNNASGNDSGYANFTGVTPTLSGFAGQTIELNITATSDPGRAAFIDWNGDFDFDISERVFTSGAYVSGTSVTSFQIPEDQPNGEYRLRVVANWFSPNPIACSVNINGETEDYVIIVTDAPSCLAPEGLQVDEVTTSTATISWDAVDNAANYTWFVFEAGDNPEEDTPIATGTTATISALVEGLEDASTYQAYVQADCDVDGESELSSAVVFGTSCNSVDVFPYEYGFEGDGSLDTCWEANNLTGNGNWNVATVSADGFQPNSGEYLAFLQWGALKTAELISAPLNLSAIGGPAEMSIFLHRHSGANATNDFYKIHINNSPSLSGATELLQIFSRNNIEPAVPANGFYEYTMSIPESFESSTEAYIIIEGSASGWDIAVDDISIYEAPEPTFANVQIIHNSPDPAASSVDVYVNGDLLPELTGLDFRNATAFLEVPAETDLEIDVVPAGGELSASVHNQTFNLAPDENYVVVANGLLADFELTVFSGARLAADDASDVDVLVHHGSPDAPAVDVAIDGVGVVVPNISFPQFQGYLSVSPVDVELQILPAGGDTPVAVYAAALSALEGAAVTVVASGLFGDGAVESNSFGLWVATATGGALIELPLVEEDDDAPMEPAPTPTEDENLVISLFSNAYDDVPVNTWLTPWSNAQLEDIQIQGVDTKLYTNLDFAGVEMTGDNSIDATQMTKFHVDVWTPNMTTVRVKLVDFGPDNVFGGGDDTEHELVFEDLTIGEWNSLELDLEDFVNLTNTANISQLIFSGLVDGVPGLGTLYVDNVYFSQPSLSNADFDATNFTYYPNPVKNELTIQSANTVEKVEVYNMLGQRVINARPNSKTPSVQMGDLTSGVYLMKVSINGTEKSFQVIKQ